MAEGDRCANCEVPGHPGHHYGTREVNGFEGYICFPKDGRPEAAPPGGTLSNTPHPDSAPIDAPAGAGAAHSVPRGHAG